MKKYFILLFLSFFINQLIARPPEKTKLNTIKKTATGCAPSEAAIDLDINNVRAQLSAVASSWWDKNSGEAKYEVPKGSGNSAFFATFFWIGAYERTSGNLKVAAQTFRQSGDDFWTGPIENLNTATTNFQTCADWDRFWKINKIDIDKFRALYQDNANANEIKNSIAKNENSIAQSIKDWPGRGTKNALTAMGGTLFVPNRNMAPFVDVNNDAIYNWRDGDYPKINGDQFIWWVFNDVGDIKANSGSAQMGIEMQSSAYAFKSSTDCINNTTFYNFSVNYFGKDIMDSTYLAIASDADLGYSFDDYIGCDTTRNLGIIYNGDNFDENAYLYNTPMSAIDILSEPFVYDNKSLKWQKIKMSTFLYFNNDFTRVGNPETADDYYGYMTGTWKDGTPFTNNCYPESQLGTVSKFVFPSDPCDQSVDAISEPKCNNVPFDRRFIQSIGPFTMIPGAQPIDMNYAALFVPNAGYGSNACFNKIRNCDDYIQDLFNNNFSLPKAPQAPEVNIVALNEKLVFNLTNPKNSNNYLEQFGYNLTDPKFRSISTKAAEHGYADSLFTFEGYVVYQLKNADVKISDLRDSTGNLNTEKARIVFQCDKNNAFKNMYNYQLDYISSAYNTYFPSLMVAGENKGIKHSFQISEDAFALGENKKLINYKNYYYLVVAYAVNKFDNDDSDNLPNEFDAFNFNNTASLQYIESSLTSSGNVLEKIACMPQPFHDDIYTQTKTDYGDGLQLVQLEGTGNGGREVYLQAENEMEIVMNNSALQLHYQPNYGPVDVHVIDPQKLIEGNFEISLLVNGRYNGADSNKGAIANQTTWQVKNLGNNEVIYSDYNINDYNEQLIKKWGIAIGLNQVLPPGNDSFNTFNNGLISSKIIYEDDSKQWLSGISDNDTSAYNNWILAGIKTWFQQPCKFGDWVDNVDRFENYEKVLNGTWAPYNLVSNTRSIECGTGFMYNSSDRFFYKLNALHSFDIVFTPDKNLWTKCPVIEMSNANGDQAFGEGNQYKFNIRRHAAWNKKVDAQGNPIYEIQDSGYSWLPAYVIDLETGKRLNVLFGEESRNVLDHGNDMLFNPTSVEFDPVNGALRWGGKHVIYILNTTYDEGKEALSLLKIADKEYSSRGVNNLELRALYKTVQWVGNVKWKENGAMAGLEQGFIPTKTRLSIRVHHPYNQYVLDDKEIKNNAYPRYQFSTKGMSAAEMGDADNTYTHNRKGFFDNVKVVPNPYLDVASSGLDRNIKITNLTEEAYVEIYTIDGKLVRKIAKDDMETYVNWDLKNNANEYVLSGMYLLHVRVPIWGKTTLKAFVNINPNSLGQR